MSKEKLAYAPEYSLVISSGNIPNNKENNFEF